MYKQSIELNLISLDEPRDNQIYTTTDYSLFKTLSGNRKLNKKHLIRLKKAISKKYLFTIIIVNEKYEIIDGQHRFFILKELGLPIYYKVCRGYGIEEVHIYNSLSRDWKTDDYLSSHIKTKKNNYILYKGFIDKYNIKHHEAFVLLGNGYGLDARRRFERGELRIKDFQLAEYNISRILSLEPFYKGVRRRNFILVMLLLFKNNNFIFDEFVKKLKIQPTSLKDCPTKKTYISLIESIYNYKRKDKINLRY
jgi:hypothetical protein